jgi:hypothetical protein
LVPPSTLFSKYGETPTDQGKTPPGETDPEADKVGIYQETVKNLFRSGLDVEKIKTTEAYRKLVATSPELATAALANF